MEAENKTCPNCGYCEVSPWYPSPPWFPKVWPPRPYNFFWDTITITGGTVEAVTVGETVC